MEYAGSSPVSDAMKHHTKDKGDLGQAKIYCDLIEQGLMVLLPQTEHAPFDLVAYDGTTFYRVQVRYKSMINGRITISFRQCWSDKNGVHIKYWDKDQIDVVGAYCPDNNQCYYFKPDELKSSLTLRIDKPKNTGGSKITWASDFTKFPPT